MKQAPRPTKRDPFPEENAFASGVLAGFLVARGSWTGDSEKGIFAVKVSEEDIGWVKAAEERFGGDTYGPYFHRGKKYFYWKVQGWVLASNIHYFNVTLPPFGVARRRFGEWRKKYSGKNLGIKKGKNVL